MNILVADLGLVEGVIVTIPNFAAQYPHVVCMVLKMKEFCV